MGILATLLVVVLLPSLSWCVDLTSHVVFDLHSPNHDGKHANLQVHLPTRGERAIAEPADLFDHVQHTWQVVVQDNQHGLTDPKSTALEPLSVDEAWHHYQAGQNGVVDSGRFLVTFGLVPSLQTGGDPIHVFAALGDVDNVRRLVDTEDVDVDTPKASDGTTALHIACTIGHRELAASLIQLGANVEAVGNAGATPLMIASTMGHSDLVQLLVVEGEAMVDRAHQFGGSTALHFAAEMGHAHVIRLLCDNNASVELPKKNDGTALHIAVDSNQLAATEALLSPPCGADPRALMMKDTTPLYLAAQKGYLELCALLLAHPRVDVNFEMPTGTFRKSVMASESHGGHNPDIWYDEKNLEVGNGATALHVAAENGHPKVVSLLLESGATQRASMEGVSPLILSIQYRHPDIASIFLQQYTAGTADLNINLRVPRDGTSALHAACEFRFVELVRTILAVPGVDVDVRNRRGETPLLVALLRNNHAIVQLLLENGANPFSVIIQSGKESSALVVAAQVGLPLVKSVMQHTRVSCSPTRERRHRTSDVTALHTAIESGHTDIIEFLLDHADCDCDARILRTGMSPLLLAVNKGLPAPAVRSLLNACPGSALHRAGKKLFRATSLYLAVEGRHFDLAKMLLAEQGVPVNMPIDEYRVTPMHRSCELGDARMAQLLLRNGANIEAENANGFTPLLSAAMGGHGAVTELLVAADARARYTDQHGKAHNALHATAATSMHVGVMRALLQGAKAAHREDVLYDLMLTDSGNVIVEALSRFSDAHRASEHDQLLGFLDVVFEEVPPAALHRIASAQTKTGIGLALACCSLYSAHAENGAEKRLDELSVQVLGVMLARVPGAGDMLTKSSRRGVNCFHMAAGLERVRLFKYLLQRVADPHGVLHQEEGGGVPSPLDIVKQTRNYEMIKIASQYSAEREL